LSEIVGLPLDIPEPPLVADVVLIDDTAVVVVIEGALYAWYISHVEPVEPPNESAYVGSEVAPPRPYRPVFKSPEALHVDPLKSSVFLS
jgi:hypothetical protein